MVVILLYYFVVWISLSALNVLMYNFKSCANLLYAFYILIAKNYYSIIIINFSFFKFIITHFFHWFNVKNNSLSTKHKNAFFHKTRLLYFLLIFLFQISCNMTCQHQQKDEQLEQLIAHNSGVQVVEAHLRHRVSAHLVGTHGECHQDPLTSGYKYSWEYL